MPFVSSQTLSTLCLDWKLTSYYLDKVILFLRKVDWDLSDEVLLTAILIAGEFLREKFNHELLELLVNIYKNPPEEEGYVDRIVQAAAYESLARTRGERER